MGLYTKICNSHPKLMGHLLNEFPLREINSSGATIKQPNLMVPPVVYQTWEKKWLGKTHYKEWKQFRELNPGFDFVIMDQAEVDEYMASSWGLHPIYEIYKRAIFGPMKVDIFRYCLIYERGGFYFDINKGVRKPIDQFVEQDSSALISYEHDICHIRTELEVAKRLQHPHHFVLNWGFGFTKEHPILKNAIDYICHDLASFEGMVFKRPSKAVVKFTGPNLLTHCVHDALKQQPNLKISQAGINFNGEGITGMKRGWVRYSMISSYTQSKNSSLLTSHSTPSKRKSGLF